MEKIEKRNKKVLHRVTASRTRLASRSDREASVLSTQPPVPRVKDRVEISAYKLNIKIINCLT